MTDTDLARLTVAWTIAALGATLGVLIGWPIVVSMLAVVALGGCGLAYRALRDRDRYRAPCSYRLAAGRPCLLDAGHPGAHYATIVTMHPEGAP